MQLPTQVAKILKGILRDSANPGVAVERLERMIALADGLQEQTKTALTDTLHTVAAALSDEGASMKFTQEMLKDPQLQDHIQTEVATATKALQDKNTELETTNVTLEKDLQQTKDQLQASDQLSDSLSTDLTALLIDNIVGAAVKLKKPQISVEQTEDSVKAYREKLQQRKLESLKDTWSDFKTELTALSDAPTQGVKQETTVEDGKTAPTAETKDDKKDGEEDTPAQAPLKDVNDAVTMIFNTEDK